MIDARPFFPTADLPARGRPALFRSLGADDPPRQVQIAGGCYRLSTVFKHDSWAATALYWSVKGQVICKFHRQQRIGPLPMKWAGKLLAQHEIRILQRLAGIQGVPAWRGPVCVEGEPWPNAVAREFIPGQPLSCYRRMDYRFFEELRQLLQEMHCHGVAYVDLHKPENVLVGDDGRPYLFDFQVSYALPERACWRCLGGERVLRLYRGLDEYHLQKHVRKRCREMWNGVLQRPWWVSAHRRVAQPLRTARRRLLTALGVRHGDGRASSELLPELGLRAAGPETHSATPRWRPTGLPESLPPAASHV